MRMAVKLQTASVVSQPTFNIPDDSPAVYALPDLADAYYVRTPAGSREMMLTLGDFKIASSSAEAIVPTWASAERVIVEYGLEALVVHATEIMREVFGSTSRIVPEIMSAADSVTPMLVLRLHVPRNLRHLREGYLDRYSAETQVPENAPAPALLWTYQDASVPA